jgi:phosphopantetheinyl transferase
MTLCVIDSLRIVESAICEEERRSIRLHNEQDACFALQMLIFNAFGLQIRMNWSPALHQICHNSKNSSLKFTKYTRSWARVKAV